VTGFSNQSFAARFGTMGDPAEAAFDMVHPKNHALGLNRPPFSMSRMAAPLRYTPDRLTNEMFVECMGIGGDGTLKIKDEKVEALKVWEHVGPVALFVYDSKKVEWYLALMSDWQEALDQHGKPATYPEGKTYRRLHRKHFPTDPTAMPDAT